ncbi:PREDICTED: 2-hydroxyacylsphingosine 1-beta-galactosyltransferase-like isoform X1 [Gavialis gangeticus]|uniref:2-hydroxyacylsphingosine 1-beta-galactosyltransferase-like isoform X1 n=1 Tax=Gavialis gangeticus TaxID=94835 RepID=UPI00092F4FA4|nr:PREDICTED: 2-hydroxyacylsphingosine 1-beta-galactosyltransferase-like isoform X1 [Gavialis gangeticus]
MKMTLLPYPTAVLFLVAALNLELCCCAKVLMMPTVIFDSHLHVFMRVAEALSDQGHDPVLLLHEGREMDSFLPGFRIQKYKGTFSTESADAWMQEKIKHIFQGKMISLQIFSVLEKYVDNCDLVLGNTALLQHLRSEDFDLFLVDPNEMCGFILAHFLGVKYVALSTGFWFPAEIGATSPIAYVPEFNSLMTDRMGLAGRTWNLLVFLIIRIATKLVILPKFEHLMQKHGVEPQRSMMDLFHGTSLFFLCNDVVLDFPRPTLPHVIFTGGILAEPAKPLPVQGLRLWVEAADAGVIVVSFGIGIRALPSDMVDKMAGAFARLPQRVIWRYFGPKPAHLGENMLMMEWLPQNDLLGHPNVKAFVSHCGMNGIFEAIYHGVPVVGFPFYGDQFDIMTRVQAKGMGILMDWSRFTEDDLYQAIVTVISDPSYHKAAKLISALHLDTPMHALNRTVYWLEYLLRHDGAPYLRPAVYDLSFYEYYCLDVLALFLLCLVGAAFALYKVIVWYMGKGVRPMHLNGQCPNGHLVEEKKLK